jgi:outer membrane protein
MAATAQTPDSTATPNVRYWSLRECIDYAMQNNVELRQTALEVENAKIELNTSQNSRLPNVNANLNGSFGLGRFADETGSTTVYHNSQSIGSSFMLSAGMPVFHGFRINNQIKADRLELEAATEGLERAKQNLELAIAGYYLEVLFKKEILAVHREQCTLSRRQVENTRAMVKAHRAALSQLYDMEAQLAEHDVAEVNASNDLALALLNLEQVLNVADGADFDIAEPELDVVPAAATLRSPEQIFSASVDTRPAVRQAQHQLRSSEYQVKIAQSAWWPSVSLSADASASYTHAIGLKHQLSFAEQIKQHREGVGLNMSIPIFNRNATRNSVRQARLGVENRRLALEGVRLALYKEIQQAWQGAVSAGARYEATTKALKAAQEAARTMELRYEEGKATALEYGDAYTRLISSRSEQTQAKYDYLFRTKILDFYSGLPINL